MVRRFFTPRIIAAVWAVYAAATSAGYYGKSITALTPVESVLPAGSPMLAWALAAALLTVGAVAPATPRWAATGRVCRTAGIAIVGALLTMWAASYASDALMEGSRMWVSAKNYVALAAAALASSTMMGRDHARQ